MANVLEPSETQRTRTEHLGSTVTFDEPKQATNAAMNLAIVAAVVIGIAMFVAGFFILKNRPYTDAATPHSAPMARVNGQPMGAQSTLKPTNDSSNVGKQAVAGDALTDIQIGDQK